MKKLYKNKRGDLVLRHIIFMIIVFSGIIALSSIFVHEMGDTYENVNMTSLYNQNTIGSSQLYGNATVWKRIAKNLQGNIAQMLIGGLEAAGESLKQVVLAPATFSSMLLSILEDFGVVSEPLITTLGFILTSLLYILIVFAIISAFLKGGKL